MDLGFSRKSVVITGGASNIGRAISLGFAREGANITIAEIDLKQAETVAEEARTAGADIVQVEALFAAANTAHGAVDVLVNNVGWDDLMFFTQTTPELWQKIIQVNFVGVLNCTRTALTEMLANKNGSIVSISSDASRQGESREAVYGGMKAAVNSFMKTIAKENGRFGVRCNVVCPGVTIPEETGEVGVNSMWADKDAMFTEDQIATIAKSLPLRKLGRPEDVANAVLFLASNEVAGHVTGQVLSVSGGYSMIG